MSLIQIATILRQSASVTEKQRRADLSASLQKLKDRIPGSESLSNRQQLIEAGVAYIDSLRYTIGLLEFDKRMLQSERKWLMEQSTSPDFAIGRGGPASSSDTVCIMCLGPTSLAVFL